MKRILLALVALVIAGCSHRQSHNELLCRAEQMVFIRPDSVVRMLSPDFILLPEKVWRRLPMI